MKTADELMKGMRPYEEKLLFFLLLLRGCKTREDVEAACNDPMLKYHGFTTILRELAENLPQIIKALSTIYGDEKGGEQ